MKNWNLSLSFIMGFAARKHKISLGQSLGSSHTIKMCLHDIQNDSANEISTKIS